MFWATLVFQLFLSGLLGAMIGWDREQRKKAAGYRTLSIVGMGVTLFTQMSQYGFGSSDPARIAAQIVTGIGFLGAGLIIFHEDKVKNLTTAATVWVVAAMSMAVAIEWYGIAIFVSLATLTVLRFLPNIQRGSENSSGDE